MQRLKRYKSLLLIKVNDLYYIVRRIKRKYDDRRRKIRRRSIRYIPLNKTPILTEEQGLELFEELKKERYENITHN